VTSLLAEISNEVTIKFVASDHDGWGSNMEDGSATIWWSGCRHPSASLAHELLHLRLQLQGYKRARIIISNIADPETNKRLMGAIDNEIQHHKFYADFLAAGFEPHQFYMDSDADTEHFLDGETNGGPHSAASVAINFLTLMAPGGSLTDSAKSRLRDKFDALESGTYRPMLGNIQRILDDWTASPGADATAHIKELLLAIRPTDNFTWYGFRVTDRPPDTGIFVDQEFAVVEP
jgi:hypothetical protein